MELKLNFTDLKFQYKSLEKDIDAAIKEVLESTQFINGPQVKKLEEEIAALSGAKYGIGVSSGTDALLLALMAIGLQPGDEVITTPFTFIATAEVISFLKAKPVFVDIDDNTYNIDVTKIEEKITDKTKAIIPVHLYGQPVDMDELNDIAKKHNLYVIEDAAQAIGAEYKDKKVCGLGDMGCLSFFPSKNLGGYGDGGMITTNNEDLKDKLLMLRNHGSAKKYVHQIIGTNARLDTLQAAILLVKIKYIEEWNNNRIRIANRYSENLKKYVRVPFIRSDRKAIFHQYTIRTDKRDDLQQFLFEQGIPTAIHYPIPLHKQEAFKYLDYNDGDFPVSENLAKEVISLPMFPEMTEEQQDMVINSIKNFYEK